MNKSVDTLAKIIWDYHQLHHTLKKCDAIFALCSLDTRVAERAAQLYTDGLGDYVIFSGDGGAVTKQIFDRPEAEIFADVAVKRGVPGEKILLESKSTNTGENIRFTSELLKEKGLAPNSFILVQKPYMERRTFATFKKQWPDRETEILVTSPQVPYESYFSDEVTKEISLNLMVGDLQRIKEYPALGYQIPQDIPKNVWQAYEQLIKLGYTKYLIR